jgi:DNA-binding Lrp family transcriptional regulator
VETTAIFPKGGTIVNQGYVKVFRKTLDSRVFQNEGLFKVWMWCLLRATHKERWVSIKIGRTTTEIRLEPGQLVFGRESAAKELSMKPSTVWKRIKKLEDMRNCNIKSDRHYSIITVMNWPIYQGIEKKGDSKSNSRGTAGEHKQECKNVKKKKKEPFVETSYELRLSRFLLDLLLNRQPDLKKPDLQKWAKEIDLMIRVDNRTPDEIEQVIRWCQQDSFWQTNIRSTRKLREKFDQLKDKMAHPSQRRAAGGLSKSERERMAIWTFDKEGL